MQLTANEVEKRSILKNNKPYVYEKVLKFNDMLKTGKSIAIIQFQYNYICNFKCVHCSIKPFQEKFPNKRKFTIDDIKKLSKEADELGLARFVITGGEPLIFKDLDAVVKAINPEKFYINCDTNGWYLDNTKAKHLKEIGIDRIQLSIDSLNAKEHDEFRRAPGSHKRAMEAVDVSVNAGLEIFIQTVVTKQRLHTNEFLEFVKYFNDKNIGVFITYAKPVGAWQGKNDMLVDKNDMDFVRKLEKQYNLFTHLTNAYERDMGCIAVKGMISVTEYGDVLPCPYIHATLGNVFEEPLKDIIQRGLNIKWFGEYKDTCLIAEDRYFIEKYIHNRIDGKQLPVPVSNVFFEEDKTILPFNEFMKQENKI
jgi:MoaA/NifB/PqqE/SkfB family radical SAM enzyme